MRPTQVPEHVERANPDMVKIRIGPPPSVPDEDCGTIEGLVGEILDGSSFHGARQFKVYWSPSPSERGKLMRGHPVELTVISNQMVPHSMKVVEEDGR